MTIPPTAIAKAVRATAGVVAPQMRNASARALSARGTGGVMPTTFARERLAAELKTVFSEAAKRTLFTIGERNFEPKAKTPVPTAGEDRLVRTALPSATRLSEINRHLNLRADMTQPNTFTNPRDVQVFALTTGETVATGVNATKSDHLLKATEGAAKILNKTPQEVFDFVVMKNVMIENHNPQANEQLHYEMFDAIRETASKLGMDKAEFAVLSHPANHNIGPDGIARAARDAGFSPVSDDEARAYPEFETEVEAAGNLVSFGTKEYRDQTLQHGVNVYRFKSDIET